MRLVSCEYENKVWLGVEQGERIFLANKHPEWDVAISSMLSLLDAGS